MESGNCRILLCLPKLPERRHRCQRDSEHTETFNAEIAGTNSANEAVDQWLNGVDMTAVQVVASSSEVTVTVTGPDEPPPIEELASLLEEELGKPVDVEVNWIPRTTYELTTPD